MVQIGINGDPKVQKKWKNNIPDDPVKASNTRGTVSFAMAGKGTRTTQIFFNTVDNSRLDNEGFAPFGEVIRYGSHALFKSGMCHVCHSQLSMFSFSKWNGCN